MTESVSASALYRLLAFLSPAFPIGAFTYSHGLEQAVEDGVVENTADLEAWLTEVLRFGAGRNDAILMVQAWHAARSGDIDRTRSLRELGLALQPSKERLLESAAQGTAFVGAVSASWQPDTDTPAGSVFGRLSGAAAREQWPYPVAVGLVCAAHDIPLAPATMSFLQAFAGNIVSAAVRAVPLGQSDGQQVIASLEAVIAAVAAEADRAELDDLGGCAFLSDIASMAHETKYSRLFRS